MFQGSWFIGGRVDRCRRGVIVLLHLLVHPGFGDSERGLVVFVIFELVFGGILAAVLFGVF
jgi:hypothetical protein